MTLMEAISKVDAQKHNTCALLDKIGWLSQLDGLAGKLIAPAKGDFAGYDDETPGDTELQIPAPFDEVYLYWLESKIDYLNGEISRFNNANAMFEAAWQRFAAFAHRQDTGKKSNNQFH